MDEEKKTNPTAEEPENTAEPDKEPEQDNGLPKTQEELDALIEKRLSRERRKFERQQAKPQQTTETTEPTADTAAMEAANREIMTVRAQLDAVKSGVRADVVEDAVYLAVKEAEKSGEELDDEAIKDALNAVLKRHPDWKSDDKKKAGIKVGADPEEGKNTKKSALPSGTVIF